MNLRNCLLASACMFATSPALAQEAQVDLSAETADEGGLGEIIVTAQRRGENLQDVPIAISAVTAEMAEKLGVTNAQNLTQLIPGFTFQRQASGSTPFIRGVGSTSSFIGNEPSSAIFIDDVYVNNGNAAVFEFNNIDLVEVLKGPQGTLFGRNATGGVVHVHTRNPTYEPTADVSVTYGNYETITSQAYASLGLGDKVAFNVAGFYSDQGEGWGTNVVTGKDILKNNSYGVRSKLLIEPDDTLSILLSAAYNRRKSNQGFATRVVDGFRGFGGYDPIALGAGYYDGATSAGIDQNTTTKFQQYSGKVTKEFDGATLVSITGYGITDTSFRIDLDAAPLNILNADVSNDAKTFTQEVQLLSAKSSKFSWIVGGFFLKDNSFFGLSAFGLGIPAVFGPGARQTEQDRQKTTSFSGFAQATAEIFPATNLTLGVRYTSDKRSQSGGGAAIVSTSAVPGPRSGLFASSETFNAVTGRVALDHKISDDIMIYAAFNRGFKSGVFNLPGYSVASTAALPAVKPEKLNAYTVGFKSEFLDRRVRLNAEAYYYDYSNIQVQNNVPPPNVGTILTNGGKATIKGVDVDLTLAPVDRLTITAGVAYAHGRYDEFLAGPMFFPRPPNARIAVPATGCALSAADIAAGYPTAGPGVPAAQRTCDLSGNKTVNTPPFSATIAVLYTLPTSIGDFDFATSWAHGGNYFSEPDNLSFIKQGKTDIVNASIRWTSSDTHLNLRLWANNITKQEYAAYFANGGTSGPKYSPAAPRTYGVTAGFKF